MSSFIRNDSSKCYVICAQFRVGSQAFGTTVEYRHFPPCSKFLNDQFSQEIVQWIGRLWFVISVPQEFTETAQKIARELGLKLCEGVPTNYKNEEVKGFPLPYQENVFTLENRERPALHCVPYMLESEWTINIIIEAEKLWNADFSKSIKSIEGLAASAIQDQMDNQETIQYKLLSKKPSAQAAKP